MWYNGKTFFLWGYRYRYILENTQIQHVNNSLGVNKSTCNQLIDKLYTEIGRHHNASREERICTYCLDKFATDVIENEY